MLILEVVALIVLGLFTFAALFIARDNPDDPIYVFCKTFWRHFIYPQPIPSVDGPKGIPLEDVPEGGREIRAERERKFVEQSDEDAKYGRIKPGADGVVHSVNLAVYVTPHAANDSVIGRSEDGIALQVTAAAEEGAANKAVIQLIADALGLKPYQVTLTKGHYQTRKGVAITGMDAGTLEERLDALPTPE
jgi:uncharacterized protein YggU (UPF0235/DUF167 family)